MMHPLVLHDVANTMLEDRRRDARDSWLIRRAADERPAATGISRGRAVAIIGSLLPLAGAILLS